MDGGNCIEVWRSAAPRDRAVALDAHSPNCGCQSHSLRSIDKDPVRDEEYVARVLTTPSGYDVEQGEHQKARLTATCSSGLSVIRPGASDEEIELTVRQLTEAQDASELIGAAILSVADVRNLGDGTRWFCVYDTEDEGKERHADILATTPKAENPSQKRKIERSRRDALQKYVQSRMYFANSVEQLVAIVRQMEAGQLPEPDLPGALSSPRS